MKTKNRQRLEKLSAVAFAVAGMMATESHAATIAWGGATNISGDSDVSTAGTVVTAQSFGGGGVTVNTVSFGNVTGTAAVNNADFSISVSGGNQAAFSSTSAPFSGLSTAYKSVISGGRWADGYLNGPVSLTLTIPGSTLLAGHQYLLQVWSSDPRSTVTTAPDRNTSYTDGSGNTVNLQFNTANVVGSPGQFAVGTINGDGTALVLNLTTTASPLLDNPVQINAFQLRDLGLVPEPGSLTLAGIAGALLAIRRRRA